MTPEMRASCIAISPTPKRVTAAGPVNGRISKRAPQVYLNENVFMGMVLSCVEVYKKECFGLLLGYRTPEKYIVEHAIAYQSVRRGHNWAELRSDKWKVLQEMLRNFPRLDVLGDFHSHTMYRDVKAQVSLSREDIDYMDPDDLQIVIAVNQNRRSRAWSLNSDRTISGSIDKFYFKIAAYYFPDPLMVHGSRRKAVSFGGAQGRVGGSMNGGRAIRVRPRMAHIVCPFVGSKYLSHHDGNKA